MYSHGGERIGHLISAIAFQQQKSQWIRAVIAIGCNSAHHDVLKPVIGGVQAIAPAAKLRGRIVSRAAGQVNRLRFASFRRLLFGSLGALVEFQTEAIN